MIFRRNITAILIVCMTSGCAVFDGDVQKKPTPTAFITTPVSYYSTPKARYLGTKYKENLERLAARIVRDPKTASLQFANNISSVGGIGFFTHSAAKTPDERYLEVVLATPETYETQGDYSEKVSQLFARYGLELLSILSGDREIYQDKELSGYGLNLAWRNVVGEGPAGRVAMARAIIYLPKERVLDFLRDRINANNLLANAVIFAVEDDGPLRLVSYQPHQTKPDYRPAIHEDNLASAPVGSTAPPAPSSTRGTEMNRRAGQDVAVTKPQPAEVKEQTRNARPDRPNAAQAKAATKLEPVAANDQKALPRLPEVATKPARAPLAGGDDTGAEKLALEQKAETAPPPPAAKAPPVPLTVVPAEDKTKDREVKRAATAPAVEVEAPPVSNQNLRSDEEGKARATTSAITAKPALDSREKQEPSKGVVKESVGVTSATAPTVAAVPSGSNRSTEAERENAAAAPSAAVKKPALPSGADKPTAAPTVAKITDAKAKTASAVSPSAAKSPEPASSRESAKGLLPVSAARNEAASIKPAPPATVAPGQKKIVEKPAPEQLASLKKPSEPMVEKKALARPAPKPLEGFIIQVAFNNKEKARNWAEKMEQRGYAVSVTEAGAEGSLRVRLGNFAVRDEAERQLKNLKQDGVNGIIINLPQAFRPEARTSVP